MVYRSLVALTLSVAAFGALANAGKLSAILEQQREIREQTEVSTGTYARFEPAELDRMHRAQDRIFQMLNGVNEIEQLDAERQAELFNAIEEVKAVIAHNEDDRQICRREHKLGSTMKQTVCATVAERRAITEAAQDLKGKSSICANGDCGGGR